MFSFRSKFVFSFRSKEVEATRTSTDLLYRILRANGLSIPYPVTDTNHIQMALGCYRYRARCRNGYHEPTDDQTYPGEQRDQVFGAGPPHVGSNDRTQSALDRFLERLDRE